MRPIAQHNAALARHAAQWFPPVPGKTARAFTYHQVTRSYLGEARPIEPRPGYLNYDGKFEVLALPDGTTTTIWRRDMTDAEFLGLPTHPPGKS